MRLVHRPRDGREGSRCLAELRSALDAEGVAPGAPFQVAAVVAVDLSGPGAARAADPETARQAALNPALDRARARCAVLVALARLGEATSREVAEYLGVDRSSVSPRLNELGPGAPTVRYEPPLVRKTGRVRPGLGSGVHNETWQLTEQGAAWLALREVHRAA